MSRTALVALLVLAAPALADDKKPDLAAMMAAWAKHATPGPEHKKLDPLVGSWTYTGKMWMDPAAPPEAFTGTTDRKWIFDGRFLQDDTTGNIPNMPPFRGIGFTGYDNTLKKYCGFWIDNMTSSMMTSAGTVDSSGKVFTNSSEGIDAMTGKPYKGRDVTTIVSPDEHTIVMYKLEGGKEIKVMEMTVKRKK
jgi:hypothetical protein